MNKHRGAAWWESLHPWQKMAVVRNFPFVRGSKLAAELGLKSKNQITSVRLRINERQRLGKLVPEPCSPEHAGALAIPPTEPATSGLKGQGYKYIQKPQPESDANGQPARPLCLEKPKPCCEAGCLENAVPKLSFCVTHAKLRYKPLTPQIERLIAAAV